MPPRGKRNTNTPSIKTHNNPNHSNNDQHSSSFEGDNLVTLLNSLQKVIESGRQSNKVLPDKLWYKRQFAVGINEVTRILEQMNPSTDTAIGSLEPQFRMGEIVVRVTRRFNWSAYLMCPEEAILQAVLLASDCNPKWLNKHLPSLASSRNVAVIYLRDRKEGSMRLGELIKVKTAIAIGVKAKGSNINQFFQRVVRHDDLKETGCLDLAQTTTV